MKVVSDSSRADGSLLNVAGSRPTVIFPLAAWMVMADFGQTDFGQVKCFRVLTDFGQTDFGQF